MKNEELIGKTIMSDNGTKYLITGIVGSKMETLDISSGREVDESEGVEGYIVNQTEYVYIDKKDLDKYKLA